MSTRRDSLWMLVPAVFYAVAAVTVNPISRFGEHLIHPLFGVASAACLVTLAFPRVRFLRAASAAIVSVVAVERAIALWSQPGTGPDFYRAWVWFYVAALQLIVWPRLLPRGE